MLSQRHWRSYGTDPLPTAQEAYSSWFLRIECDRCGMVVMHSEAHIPTGSEGCGGARWQFRRARANEPGRTDGACGGWHGPRD
jgi:hypothetical protein